MTFDFYNTTLITQLENSLLEVAHAEPLVEETDTFIGARNFSLFQREVAQLSTLGADLLTESRTQLRSAMSVHLKIMDISGVVSDQTLQLRKTTKLFKSAIRASAVSSAVQCLQRIMVQEKPSWYAKCSLVIKHCVLDCHFRN